LTGLPILSLGGRPWTIAALAALYLVRPILLIVDTLMARGRPALGPIYLAPVAFVLLSFFVAVGLWFRWRPAWMTGLAFDVIVLAAAVIASLAFLLSILFGLVLIAGLPIAAYSGVIVALLLAPGTRRALAPPMS
jgi:hypothetical protein